MASLMPTSRLDGDGPDEASDDSSADEAPMTAEQIREMRSRIGAGQAEEAAPRRDFAEELKDSKRVPMMFGTSAAGSVRIDWARIDKDDMRLFIDKYATEADAEGQTIREAATTTAWLLQKSLRTCLALMLEVAEKENDAGLVSELQAVQNKVSDTLAVDHLRSRKGERNAYQQDFDHMTDAVQDVCAEMKRRLEQPLGPHSSDGVSSAERVRDLLDGLLAWLEAGADPAEQMTWSGLQLRLTWVPTLESGKSSLFVESMEMKKRRKKHIAADALHRDGKSMLHHANQSIPRSYGTRGWLLQHALEKQLDILSELLSSHTQSSEAVTKSVAELRRSVDAETALGLVVAEGGSDYAADLVDAVDDFVSEFKARAGRLARHAPLGADDTTRVQHLVEEVRSWLDGGVDAAKAAQSSRQSTPWRCQHSSTAKHRNRIAHRWNAVFATGARVWRMLDVFDADDVKTLKSMVLCGMSLDMILDEGGETLLMAAAQRNATACVEWLLDEGAETNAANDDGSTAFHYACAFGSLHCIASLLKHDCDVDAKDDEGQTGADLAEAEPWRDILNMMLTLGFDKQWKELEVLIDDQTRVRSLEDLVAAEADKRRPHLEYQSLPPSRWLEHHVIRWLEDAFAWSSEYLGALKEKSLTGQRLVTSDDESLLSQYEITSKTHRQELMQALKDQDLWGWE